MCCMCVVLWTFLLPVPIFCWRKSQSSALLVCVTIAAADFIFFLWLLTFIPALLLLLRTISWQNAESLPANSASTVQVPSYVTRNLKLKENSRRSEVGRAFFPSPSVVRLSLIHLAMSMMMQVHKSATKEGCRSCIVNIASRVMEENLVVCVLSEGGKFGFFMFCDAEVATGKRGEEEMWRCVLHSSLAKDMAFRYDKRVWLDVARRQADNEREKRGCEALGAPPFSDFAKVQVIKAGKMNLADLPEDCIATIISHTTPIDAARLTRVCSAFKRAIESDAVWENFLPSDYKTTLKTWPSSGSKKKDIVMTMANGVFLDQGLQKYVLLRRTRGVCRVLSVEAMNVAGGQDTRFWRWEQSRSSCFGKVVLLVLLSFICNCNCTAASHIL